MAVFLWLVVIIGAGSYFYFRDREEEWERVLKACGVRKNKKAPETEPEEETPKITEAPAADSLTAAEIEDLVERKFQERLASMSASAPVPGIPQQRAGEQVPPPAPTVSFEKAPEAVQETLPVEEAFQPPVVPASPAEPVQSFMANPLEEPVYYEPEPDPEPHWDNTPDKEPEPLDQLQPTAEEAAILSIINNEWEDRAKSRRLTDLIVIENKLTHAGVAAMVELGGTWTFPKVKEAEDALRTLLSLPTEVPLTIEEAERSGWVTLLSGTRSPIDNMNMNWRPDRIGIGVDIVTGQPVDIDPEARMSIAGASGSGKSWAARPLMARAVCRHTATKEHKRFHLVYIDGKGEEAPVWRGKARIVMEWADIRLTVEELCAEMEWRKQDMQRRGISVWDGDIILVVVDEGRVVLSYKDKELLAGLVNISSLGRSRGIVLYWETQSPNVTGDAAGMHSGIAANMDLKFCLRVKNETNARVALDEDGAEYKPHRITRSQIGHGYLGDYGRHLIKTWTLNDAGVKSLPNRKPWEHGMSSSSEAPSFTPKAAREALRPYLAPVAPISPEGDDTEDEEVREAVNDQATTLITPSGETVVVEEPFTSDEKILMALEVAGHEGLAFQALLDETSIPKPTLYRLLNALLEKGKVAKGGHGVWKLP